jgi:periplasmic protein TonB
MFTGLEAVRANPVRRWITVGSFSLQAMLVAVALIFPLLRPATLPDAFNFRRIFLPEPQGVQQPQPNPSVNNRVTSNAPVFPILVRTGPAVHVFDSSSNIGDNTQPPVIGLPVGGTDIHNIITDSHYEPVPKPPAVAHHAPPVSVMMEGNLLRKIKPRYPAIAVQMGLQGTVVIKALISREGMVEHPQVISGQAFLAQAAMDAVKEWRYRPYYLNGQPVEVETEITVNFVLNR